MTSSVMVLGGDMGDRERTRHVGRWRAVVPLVGVGGCLLVAAVIINPFREMLSLDDGWAYARSVEHLLQTGQYRLDAWAAANMPVQIYLAAGLSKIVGYSLSLLRLTTVAMLVVGLASFYGLARELGATRASSSAATVALMASPLVMLLGFTFMSDVQFMGWMLAALFLYVRGLRRGSDALVFVGSIAAVGAIGTRQFGMAIIAGLLLGWILCRRQDRPPLHTLVLGAALPAVAAGWQILHGLQQPNFTQVVRLYEQRVYLGQPPALLADEFLWRAAVVLQYVGISILPALPLLIGAVLVYARQSRRSAARLALLVTLAGLTLSAILLTGSALTGRPDGGPGRLWPPLGLDGFLPVQLRDQPGAFRPIDLAGLGAAAALGALALLSARGLRPIRRTRPETILLIATPACLLGLHLVYVQFNDNYIVEFVPFALLLLAVQYRATGLAPRWVAASPAVSLAVIVLLSLWIRADFAAQTTAWAAADRLTKAGIPAAEIYGPGVWGFNIWKAHQGAFEDWLAAGNPGHEFRPSKHPGFDTFHDPFWAWLDSRGKHAAYRVQSNPMSEPGWRLIAHDYYRTFEFKRHDLFTYQAVEQTKALK